MDDEIRERRGLGARPVHSGPDVTREVDTRDESYRYVVQRAPQGQSPIQPRAAPRHAYSIALRIASMYKDGPGPEAVSQMARDGAAP